MKNKKEFREMLFSEEQINYLLVSLNESIKMELKEGKDEDSIYGNRSVALEMIDLYHYIATSSIGM